MNLRRAFTLAEVMIVGVIIAILVAMAVPACEKVRQARDPEYLRGQYRLWCKIERRDDISFDDWKEARRANLLLPPTSKHDARN